MQRANTVRSRIFGAVFLLVILAWTPVKAHAVSKEIIELQTQVQQLLDQVQRLQSTMDTRFGALQHMVETTADDANRMTETVTTLQQKLSAQADAANGKADTVSGQVQSLNDSVDELKSRIAKLDKSIQDLQTQLQNIQNPPPGGTPSGTGAGPASNPAPIAAPPTGKNQPPQASLQTSSQGDGQAPPLQETFQAGLRDYNAAKYQIAADEFTDVLRYYPLDDLAGTAQFYLGEIAYRQQDYAGAIKAYNAVLEGFSGSQKAPAAQLRKGLALLQINKKDAGIHELRQLIQRHPQTPEASQARTKLNSMGVKIIPVH